MDTRPSGGVEGAKGRTLPGLGFSLSHFVPIGELSPEPERNGGPHGQRCQVARKGGR